MTFALGKHYRRNLALEKGIIHQCWLRMLEAVLALTVPEMRRAGHQREGNFRIKQSSMFGEVQYLGTAAFFLLIKQGSVIFDLKAATTQNPR